MPPKGETTRICEGCGRIFERPRQPNGRLENAAQWRRRRFCGIPCSNRDPSRHHPSGPERSDWKGDAARPETKRLRAQRAYDLDLCEECGATATDRHHKDGDTGNNVRENIALLCRRCHMAADGRLERFAAAKGGRHEQPFPARPCINCGRQRLPRALARGRCTACADYWRRKGCERPDHQKQMAARQN